MQLIPYRDVILVKKSNGFWNNVVKFFLKSEYSHSEFVIDDWLTFGTDLKRPAGIHFLGYNMQDVNVYRLKQSLTKHQEEIIKSYLQNILSYKYDVVEAICVGLNFKCRGRNERFICISLILDAYEKAGVLPQGTSKKYTDFTAFSQSPYFIKVI